MRLLYKQTNTTFISLILFLCSILSVQIAAAHPLPYSEYQSFENKNVKFQNHILLIFRKELSSSNINPDVFHFSNVQLDNYLLKVTEKPATPTNKDSVTPFNNDHSNLVSLNKNIQFKSHHSNHIPEPTTIFMLLSGLLILIISHRYNDNKQHTILKTKLAASQIKNNSAIKFKKSPRTKSISFMRYD